NRLAIGVASLLWLIYRSGAQPRRLSYPCQQVAALNVGAFAAGLIPALWLWRKPRCAHAVARRVVIRRQLLAAAILFVTALVGIEGYQYAQSLIPPSLPVVPARIDDPQHTIVGIAHRDPQGSWYTTAEIEDMVRLAIARAGGLDHLMTDRNNDGQISVILKPNLVQAEDPTDGVVTDPKVCAAIVKVAKEAGATHVGIAEGTAVGPAGQATWDAMYAAGYDANRDYKFDYDTTVNLYDLNDSGGLHQTDPNKVTLVTIPNGVIRTQYYVPNVLLNCDVMICVPTLKNHYNGTVTLALKNRVGCAPNDIYHSHRSWGEGFQGKLALVHYTDDGFPCTVAPCPSSSDENEIVQRTIVDLNLVRPQDFAVVDGLIGVTTGPNDKSVGGRTGKPSPYLHMIVAGADSLAVDAACSLVMDYHPDYIPHLAWADSRGVLGTKDRSMITVVGDQMWKVRSDDFPGNWGIGAVKNTDHTAPWIGNTSVNEGEAVANHQMIAVSDVGDDVGVVQATAVAAILGPNLLANGDFEAGSAGWTPWKTTWGGGEAYDFASTEPGHMGNACLKLGGASTATSFGVYQQVSVQPGRTYRIDAIWKGRKLADQNWFEILLIDGPFSLQQADDPAYVKPNFMFAYDDSTYGLAGPVGTTFGWLWTHEQYAPPVNQVDWNNRLGRRTATGNTMTVVLKAGSTGGGVEAWFDEIRLTEVLSESPIAHLANPSDPAGLEIETDHLPQGSFPAELRISVYDAALNVGSIYRNVTVSTVPETPFVCVDRIAFEQTVFVGSDATDETFHVFNCGKIGSTLDYTIEWDSQTINWLTVSPDTGSAVQGSPPNPHGIFYDTTHLKPGTYTAGIAVVGDGVNTVRLSVTVNVVTVSSDLDRDGDVDQSDFGRLQACLSGTTPCSAGCKDADLNNDGFVQDADCRFLLGCMSGPDVTPDPTCDDGP
ncbi:MAG TPA: DUF362 domain-containing protein, partial [Phycisphaerae bacterium]|nr:DUF362 domain-containing protein [Phycisphaerae bacterium]